MHELKLDLQRNLPTQRKVDLLPQFANPLLVQFLILGGHSLILMEKGKRCSLCNALLNKRNKQTKIVLPSKTIIIFRFNPSYPSNPR